MISRLLYLLEDALRYVRTHPQLWFAIGLIVVLPILLWFVSNQFLSVGRDNQDTLLKQRLGLLHDSVASFSRATDFDPAILQREIDTLVSQNPDILQFRVVTLQDSDKFVPIAAYDTDRIGTTEDKRTAALLRSSLARTDESLIYPVTVNGERHWLAYRAVLDEVQPYIIFTETSLTNIDRALQNREFTAYAYLFLVYVFLLLLAYWLYRLTDYQNLYHEAKEAIATKDLFTNMMAHELRAPVTAMRGYASMVLENNPRKEDKESLERIVQSGDRLLALVNDLLETARLQSGKISVEKNKVDLSTIVKRVVDELSITAEEKEIVLAVEGDDTTQLVLADESRLHQALTNLINNSIKYTKAGSITVAISDTYQRVELRIKDTGMGISYEDQQQLFAPFFRVKSDGVSKITGTGLGMWITKQLIELMDGTIGVESIKGTGTHIIVRLPKPTRKK